MGWKAIAMGRGFNDEDDREVREMLDRAYEDGKREGYEMAMREMHSGYGERGGYSDGGYSGGNSGDGYGERRGVKGTGPYSRYYRVR